MLFALTTIRIAMMGNQISCPYTYRCSNTCAVETGYICAQVVGFGSSFNITRCISIADRNVSLHYFLKVLL